MRTEYEDLCAHGTAINIVTKFSTGNMLECSDALLLCQAVHLKLKKGLRKRAISLDTQHCSGEQGKSII